MAADCSAGSSHPPDCLGGVLNGVLGLVGGGLALQEGRGEWVVGSVGGGGAAVGAQGGGQWRAAGPAPPAQDRASGSAAAAAHPRRPNGARAEGPAAGYARARRRSAGRVHSEGDLERHGWVLVAWVADVRREKGEKMNGRVTRRVFQVTRKVLTLTCPAVPPAAVQQVHHRVQRAPCAATRLQSECNQAVACRLLLLPPSWQSVRLISAALSSHGQPLHLPGAHS